MSEDDEAIYARVCGDLIRYAAVLVGPSEAEDVVSAVMLRLLRRRPLHSLAEPRAYLFRAVLNEARGVLRRRTRALPRRDSGDGAGNSVPEPDWEVVAAVGALPARQTT